MPIFSYTAVNPEGKTVRGTVEAPDAISAKNALKDLHYSVESISEPSRAGKIGSISEPSRTGRADLPTAGIDPTNTKPSFVYEGTDGAGVLHKGTVQAGSKREAFEQLRKNQSLTLSRLSALGSPPGGMDAELDSWKKEGAAPQIPQKRTLSFSHVTGEANTPAKPVTSETQYYHPLFSTLRLYAGWLLAWYALFVALGYYARERALPWDIPFVGAFAGSGLVFSFVVAIFFFLLLSALHRALHGKTLMGAGFAVLWIAAIVGVRLVE